MVFTQAEENILRLMIAELTARKKADAERKATDTEMRAAINPLIAQVNAAHAVKMNELMAAHVAAEKAIEEAFK